MRRPFNNAETFNRLIRNKIQTVRLRNGSRITPNQMRRQEGYRELRTAMQVPSTSSLHLPVAFAGLEQVATCVQIQRMSYTVRPEHIVAPLKFRSSTQSSIQSLQICKGTVRTRAVHGECRQWRCGA